MVIDVRCPQCGKQHPAPQTVVGKAVRCEDCGARFVAAEMNSKTMKLVCPKCERVHWVPQAVMGKTVRCDSCRHTFVARGGPAAAPLAAPSHHPRRRDVVRSASGPATVPPRAANGPGPPPLPLSTPPHITPVLDRYRKRSPGVWPAIRQQVGGAIEAVKRWARATKLRWDATNLEKAFHQQLVQLAQVALQHQPANLDLSHETAQLAAVQRELEEKDATAQALKATAGAKAALKDVKRDIAQRDDRQQTIMCQIGAKVDAARPDIPGAAGTFSAIDQLRAALEAKRAELEALSPSPPQAALKATTLIRPLVVLAGVLLVGIALVDGYSLVAGIFAGRLPAYVPSEASGIQYFDLRHVDDSEEKEKLEQNFSRKTEPLQVAMDDLRDCTLIDWQDGRSAVVFRSAYDLPLEDLVPARPDNREITEYRSSQYIPVRRSRTSGYVEGYVAKMNSRLYGYAQREDALKDILACYDRGQQPELDHDLALAFPSLSKQPCYYLASDPHVPDPGWLELQPWAQMFQRSLDESHLRALGAGIDPAADEVSCVACLVFSRDRYAQRCVEGFEDAVDELEQEMKRASGSRRDGMETLMEVLLRTKVKQHGRSVLFSVTWTRQEMEQIKGL